MGFIPPSNIVSLEKMFVNNLFYIKYHIDTGNLIKTFNLQYNLIYSTKSAAYFEFALF